MGRPKLLLPWGETSVLGHLLTQWQILRAARIVVVCAADDQPLLSELDRLAFPAENRIYNPSPADGMFSSVQRAASFSNWLSTLSHWALVLGDQPHLKTELLRSLLQFAAEQGDRITQLGRRGHGRHPVVFPAAIFSQLGASPAKTLKEFLAGAQDRIALLETDDPAVDLDVDYPADYEQALRMRCPQS